MRFARRTSFDVSPSDYGIALDAARSSGRPLFDLTVTNPTRCGFDYPEALLAPMSDRRILEYTAESLGNPLARTAVAELYSGEECTVPDIRDILLTASTSEAYGHLLRLLCDPGDAVLVPSPSYPLLDLLGRLNDVELQTYPLVYHDGWQIDPASLRAAVTPATRAIVAIHPNNPTGHYCSEADRAALFAVAAEFGLALIVDEVFLDYGVEGPTQPSFATLLCPVLTFVLGGLSKLLALPQMKLAWVLACGPEDERRSALVRLEIIADTFLSVATPPQVALTSWLGYRFQVQSQIQQRVRSNLQILDKLIEGTSISRLKVEGSWSAVLRTPALENDEDVAAALMVERGVVVHPGSFYGFAAKGSLVVSLIVLEEIFTEGVRRIVDVESKQ